MSALKQKIDWQHLVLFVAGALLFNGGIIFSIHLWGDATPRTTARSVGVVFLAGGLVLGIFGIQSLRSAARRKELARLNDTGLFELPPEPGEALVRLNARLAAHFGLSRDDLPAPPLPEEQTLNYASRLKTLPRRRPWPPTVGELRDAIYDTIEEGRARAGPRRDVRQAFADALRWPASSFCVIDTRRIPLAQFHAARDALADALGRPPESIRWSDRLASLVPPGRQRFVVWERLRAHAPQVPPVDLNPWIENIAPYVFLAALIAIAVPIAQGLDRDPATRIENPGIFGRLVGRAFGLILFVAIIVVLMIPVYAIGRRYASRLPKQIDTISTLAPYMPTADEERPWTPADVEEHVRDLVAAATDRASHEIDAATRL